MEQQVKLTDNQALLLYAKMEDIYENKGSGAVYNTANKINLPYEYCNFCATETPQIISPKYHICALCGQ